MRLNYDIMTTTTTTTTTTTATTTTTTIPSISLFSPADLDALIHSE